MHNHYRTNVWLLCDIPESITVEYIWCIFTDEQVSSHSVTDLSLCVTVSAQHNLRGIHSHISRSLRQRDEHVIAALYTKNQIIHSGREVIDVKALVVVIRSVEVVNVICREETGNGELSVHVFVNKINYVVSCKKNRLLIKNCKMRLNIKWKVWGIES